LIGIRVDNGDAGSSDCELRSEQDCGRRLTRAALA
jgi:hypothetical protein